MAATKLVVNIQQSFAIQLSVVDLFDAPTIAHQATIVEARRRQGADRQLPSPLMRLIQTGNANLRPLFFVPGGNGSEAEFLIYARLIHLLGADQTVYGFMGRGQDGLQLPHASGEAMVTDYLAALRGVQPQGPYLLTGECIGGKVAYEMARRLREQGDEVAMLLLMNTKLADVSPPNSSHAHRSAVLDKVRYHWAEMRQRSLPAQVRYLWQRWRDSIFNPLVALRSAQRRAYQSRQALLRYNRTLQAYTPRATYTGPITLLVSEDYYQANSTLGWTPLALGGLETYRLPGDRYSYLGQHVQTTAQHVARILALVHQTSA